MSELRRQHIHWGCGIFRSRITTLRIVWGWTYETRDFDPGGHGGCHSAGRCAERPVPIVECNVARSGARGRAGGPCGDCDCKQRGHWLFAPGPDGRAGQLHAGGPAAGHVQGRGHRTDWRRRATRHAASRPDCEPRPGTRGRPGEHRVGHRHRDAAVRDPHVRSRVVRDAEADRSVAAELAQLPRVRGHRAGRAVRNQRRRRHQRNSQRRAIGERRQRVHRRRRPEELRAARRCQRPDPVARQSIPAARNRRIQGDHVELQGGVRPVEQCGGGRCDALRHERVRIRGLLRSHGRELARLRSDRKARRPQGKIRAGAIRHRVRRPDHPGQDALLRDLRRQGVRNPADHNARAGHPIGCSAAGDPAVARRRERPVRGGPVLRQDRLAGRRRSPARADGQGAQGERDFGARRPEHRDASPATRSTRKRASICATSSPARAFSTTRISRTRTPSSIRAR